MASDDNVIAFPGGSPEDLARVMAGQLLSQGRPPREVISALMDAASDPLSSVFPARREPTPAASSEPVKTYRVRVDLDGAKPPIWRRLELRSDLRLDQLHEVLQTAMGWTNSHLHHFEMGPQRDHMVEPFLTEFDVEEGDEGILETDVRLDQVLAEPGDRLFYQYDFGDGWDHTIRLEEVRPYDEAAPAARVLTGRRACPPEDCGGVWGYHELLAGMADRSSADADMRERLDWMPDGFDSAEFSAEETDQLLQLTLATARDTILPEAVDESLADLVHHSPWAPGFALTDLVAEASLHDVGLPSETERRELVAPWLQLLDLVGAGGMALTQAGYLKPAVVGELATTLDVPSWMGKANREEYTLPVAVLRESATAFGLVRKAHGRLLRTRAGARVAGDSEAMWQVLCRSLPAGKKRHEKHAGVVALLCVAAAQAPDDGVRRHGPEVMSWAGWSIQDGRMDEWAAYDCARPTLDALALAGCGSGWRDKTPLTQAVQRLARAALRG